MKEFENHKFAAVPTEYQRQGIKWVRMVPSKKLEDGVFIVEYTDLSKPHLYDFWFENMKIALKQAERIHGVKPKDWMSANDIRSLGIEIIDDWYEALNSSL